MTVDEALQQLLDLPSPFKRTGPNFDMLMHSLLHALRTYTGGLASMQNQTNINNAVRSWLDVWGSMFNLPRQSGEDDPGYLKRIKSTLLCWSSTPAGISKFISDIYDTTVKVTENASPVSYQIQFNSPLDSTTLKNIATALAYVRPAGIPLMPFQVIQSGPFLTTMEYTGMNYGTGTYLGGSGTKSESYLPDHTSSAIVKMSFRLQNFPSV